MASCIIFLLIWICLMSEYSSRFNMKNLKSVEISLELADYPYPKNSDDGNKITVAILGTNDIHGAAYERIAKHNNQKYSVGGFKLLSGVIDNFRKEFGNNFLWLDAGDQYTGTYESMITNGELIRDFYDVMKLDLATIGNHEWDLGEKWLRKKIQEQSFYFAIANLKPQKGVEDLSKRISYKIIHLKNSIKIGVIGLTTKQTWVTTSNPPYNFKIIEYLNIINRYSSELRAKGVDAVILLSHVGASCKGLDEDELFELKLRDNKYSGHCHSEELMELLMKLEKGIVDAVIGGHIHTNVHHFINNIPVIQTVMSDLYTNVLYLQFEKDSKKLVNKLIEGPIPLCSHVFSSNKRCDIPQTEKSDEFNRLAKVILHGMEIIPNINVLNLFKGEFNEKITKMQKEVIAKTELTLKRNRTEDNFLRNLMSDFVRNHFNTDFSIVHDGILRDIWQVGEITKYDVYKMFPFSTHLVSFNVNGKMLQKIVKILQEGKKGFYSISGMIIEVEVKKGKKFLKSLKLSNGEEIIEKKEYSISCDEFLLTGGDDWGKVKEFFPSPENYVKSDEKIVDIVLENLRQIKLINSESLSYNDRLKIIRKED